jgi:hypothetical protein
VYSYITRPENELVLVGIWMCLHREEVCISMNESFRKFSPLSGKSLIVFLWLSSDTMETGVGSTLAGASRRTKLGRKLSRRLSLVAKVPNMISVRLKQELGGSRDSLRAGRSPRHRHLEITAIAPDKTQRIVSTLLVVSYGCRTRSHTVTHGSPTCGPRPHL